MYFSGLIDFWYNRPPVVVFLLTLAACALTLITIGVYIDVHKNNLPNPNIKVSAVTFLYDEMKFIYN